MNTIDLHIHITGKIDLTDLVNQVAAAVVKIDLPQSQITPEPMPQSLEPKSRTFSEKICIQCGKTFMPRSGRQVKCDECKSKKTCDTNTIPNPDQRITKTCPRCGKEFQTIRANRVYCYDRNCLKLATKTPESAAKNTDTHTSDQDNTEEHYGRTDYPHTCKSCGRLFFTSEEEPDRELCNDNCRPLTPTEKARQRQILESGDLMFDKEYSSKQPKQQNTNGNHKEKTSKQAKICRQKTVGEIDCN